MAIEHLAVEEQLAQKHGLLAQIHAQRFLGGLDTGGRVAHGADAADAGSDVVDLDVGPPSHERLEKAWRFDDLELALSDLAVLNVHDNVAVALDEVVAGKAVTTAETKPYGCSVKYKE